MKVIQVVPRIADESSGPSHSVPGLAGALEGLGAEVELHILEPLPGRELPERTQAHPCLPGGLFFRLGVSPKMKSVLRRAAKQVDVMHTNSLWMMPNIYPLAAVKGTGCKLVISPRGTLSEWALRRSRWRKKILGRLGQNQALRGADCLHVTAMEELKECRSFGLGNPIAIIPNGVDCPSTPPSKASGSIERNLLFLSRIHPKKGIDLLIRVWSKIEEEFPHWNLKIAGPDQHQFAGEMKRLVTRLGLRRVTFLGEVKDDEKCEVFRSSELFVLPSHNENFGIAVGEALAHGVPAVVSTGAPWSGLIEERCGWWFRLSEEELLIVLREAMSRPALQLGAMGRRGHEWIKRDFSWPAIGGRMLRTYEWLRGKGDRPDWVYLE